MLPVASEFRSHTTVGPPCVELKGPERADLRFLPSYPARLSGGVRDTSQSGLSASLSRYSGRWAPAKACEPLNSNCGLPPKPASLSIQMGSRQSLRASQFKLWAPAKASLSIQRLRMRLLAIVVGRGGSGRRGCGEGRRGRGHEGAGGPWLPRRMTRVGDHL